MHFNPVFIAFMHHGCEWMLSKTVYILECGLLTDNHKTMRKSLESILKIYEMSLVAQFDGVYSSKK